MTHKTLHGKSFLLYRLLFVLCLLSLRFGTSLSGQDIVINEIMASNQTGITDEDGDTSDWVELYNSGTDAIDLAGYSITDDADLPDQWIFPSVVVQPNSYLLIWASGKDRQDPSHLHTNFKLNAAGEFLGLFDTAGACIDSLMYCSQMGDISYGRYPDGSETYMYFPNSSPAAMNEEGIRISISMPSGIYQGSIDLELETNAADSEIYLTLWGDEPNPDDSLYTEPLVLSGTRVLKARVFVNNVAVTPIETRFYVLNDNPQLPVLSLSLGYYDLWGSNIGIYDNPGMRGINWERLGHVMLIEDGESVFSIPAGFRIHGDLSRYNAKKSFRLYFRREYGVSELHYLLFPQKDLDRFKRLIIYGPSKDQVTGSWRFTLLTDALNHSLWYSIGGNTSALKPVSVYLNNKYWGLYWIRERIDRYYIEDNFGVIDMDLHKEDWYVSNVDVKEGNIDFWLETLDFFEKSDLNDSLKYQLAVEKYVDVENFTDYHIINIFGGNYDWPQKNVDRFRDRSGDTRWRWIMWDTDVAWREPPVDIRTLFWATRSKPAPGHPSDNVGWLWSTLIIRRLLGNDGYRNYFINRFADLMNSLLSPSSVISYIDELQNMIVSEMRREMGRWGPEGPWGRQNFSDWEQNVEDVRDFARQRPWHMREQIMEKFELEDTAKVVLLPPVGDGTVRINSITPDELPWEGLYYQGVPITISAVPEPGYLFYQWSDTTLAPQPEITVNLEGDRTFQAVFYIGYLIEDIRVESITDSSADISWSTNVPTCGQITYGLSESMGYVTEKETELTEVHCIPLRDLEPDTVYFFQVACEDCSGLQNQCAVMTFRTLEEATNTQVLGKGIPEAFGLSSNYPNPFNSATCWEIALPEPGLLQAVIYNVSGQAVHRLFHRKLPEGIKRLVWDGRDDSGQALVSGVYIMRVVFEGESGKRERAAARLVMIR